MVGTASGDIFRLGVPISNFGDEVESPAVGGLRNTLAPESAEISREIPQFEERSGSARKFVIAGDLEVSSWFGSWSNMALS